MECNNNYIPSTDIQKQMNEKSIKELEDSIYGDKSANARVNRIKLRLAKKLNEREFESTKKNKRVNPKFSS